MNKIYLSFVAFFLFICCVEASAQPSFWTIHSSICEAINPAQSRMMEWRPEGLVNKDPNRPLWVMCPVMSKYFVFDSELQDSIIDIAVGNDNPQPIKVTCILSELKLISSTFQPGSKRMGHSYLIFPPVIYQGISHSGTFLT